MWHNENKRDSTIFVFALHVKSSLGVFVKFIAVVDDLLVQKTEGVLVLCKKNNRYVPNLADGLLPMSSTKRFGW